MTTLQKEAIEAAAKAICYAVFGPWDSVPERERTKSTNSATAAFDAIMDRLKEPGNDMIDHGLMALSNNGVDDAREGDALAAWQAMLSVAKGEEGE